VWLSTGTHDASVGVARKQEALLRLNFWLSKIVDFFFYGLNSAWRFAYGRGLWRQLVNAATLQPEHARDDDAGTETTSIAALSFFAFIALHGN